MFQKNSTTRLQTATRIILAGIFLYAGAMKALRPDDGQAPSTVFGEWSGSACIRYSVIAGETGLAVWLLTGLEVDLAGIVTMAVLSVLTSLIIMELTKASPKPCGCSGIQAGAANPGAIRLSLGLDLIRNVLMIAGAAWLFLSAQREKHAVIAGPGGFGSTRHKKSAPTTAQGRPMRELGPGHLFPF